MHRVVRLGARACGLLVALAACGSPPTQLVVVVDTDLEVGRDVDRIAVTVTGPTGETETEATMLAASDGASLPLTLGVTPSGDALGPITVRAVASHTGTEVVSREHRVTLVRGESRVLTLHLTRACASRSACPAGQTCGEQGCTAIEVAPDDLPRWQGEAPRLGDDAGAPVDAGPRDAGPPADGSAPSDAGPRDCERDADCDDDEVCTTDSCTDGVCVYAPADDTACDDGMFCNGLDSCMDGACTVHAGAPCAGATVCDEDGDRCTGCASDDDCPAESAGAWSSCELGDDCDESGTQSRVVRSFTCEDGACVPHDSEETQACGRATEGNSCAATTCEAWGACGGFDGACGESGTQTRSCSAGECRSGTCTARSYTETQACARDTDGVACVGTKSCTTWSTCSYPSTCAESGTQTRSCRPNVCVDGSCGLGPPMEETRSCTRDTDGDSCGTRSCPALWGACTGLGCSSSGTQTRTCTDRVCSAGACGDVNAIESRSCTRNTDGSSCDDGLWCTDFDRCSSGVCRGFDTCGGTSCECTPTGCRSRDGMYICQVQ